MKDKVLNNLEYNKILTMLQEGCVSELGKQSAEALRPSSCLDEVVFMQDETAEAQAYLTTLDVYPVIAFDDASSALKRSKIGAVLSMRELLCVASVMRAARVIKNALTSREAIQSGVLRNQAGKLYDDQTLEKRIYSCIISQDEMADSASTELNSIRRSIRRENGKIREKLGDIVRSSHYQKYLQEAIITIRNGRHVVPVKSEYRAMVPGLLHDYSASGQTLFIEPMAVVDINNNIRQLEADEKAEVERILAELTSLVSPASEDILNDIDILTHLDVVFAKALLSKRMRGIRPSVSTDGRIVLNAARHPLIPSEQVVPIDIALDINQFGLLITGPNTGGKTVTLKTVGIFVAMTQSGLHICAGSSAMLPVFDAVFADIGDEQSIEQSLSTFSSHMTNLIFILNNITENSLVLMDELGAGTDPDEGAALAMAVLDYLEEKGATAIATTHYSHLKTYAMKKDGLVNASMEFDMETLSPTFRVLMGVPGQSNGLAISKRLGLSQEIVDKATGYMDKERLDYESMLSQAKDHLKKAEQEREISRVERKEAQELLEESIKKAKEHNEKSAEATTKARIEARDIVQRARVETERVIKDLRKEAARVQELASIEGEIQRAREDIKAQGKKMDSFVENRQGAIVIPKNLKIGENVELIGHNLKASVISLPDSKGEVMVQAGVMKMSVHVSNLRRDNSNAGTKKEAVQRGKGISIKHKSITAELDVRGQRVEEALMNIDKYLDDVAVGGLGEVTVIHGKGTGALREGIHKSLRTNLHVKSFRLGNYGEGDAGVTVVKIK